MSLFRAVQAVATRTPLAPALLAPQQSVAWNFGELASRATALSRVLHRDLGVVKGSIVFTDLPNVAEGIVLQLALQRLGAAVATAKNIAGAKELADAVGAPAGSVAVAGSWLGEVGRVVLADVVLQDTSIEGDVPEAGPVCTGQPLGYFNSKKPLCDDEAVMLGERAAAYLKIEQSDRIAVAITLYHQFSHMALNAAYSQGACVVLPAVGGLHGCGVPSQRAQVTLDVLAGQRCSLLVADTHTLKAYEGEAMASQLAAADLSAMRGGVCKVGSGADFLDDTVVLKGVKLATLGKRA